MRRLIVPLIGAAMFVFGLIEVSDAIHIITDTSGVIFGFLLFTVGALLISVEMSRW